MAQRTRAPPADAPSLDLDELIAKAEAAKIASGSRKDPSHYAKTSGPKGSSSKDQQTKYLSRKDDSSKASSSKDQPTVYLSKKDHVSNSHRDPSSARPSGTQRHPTLRLQPLSSIPESSRAPTTTRPSKLIGATTYRSNGLTTYPAHTSAPPNARSILTSTYDTTMASRQTRIDTLPPDERDKQEAWAQSLIRRSGVCPQGYDWDREEGRYRCRGQHHVVTDEQLAEGRGGLWALNWEGNEWYGPYYPKDGKFFYFGVRPLPEGAVESFDGYASNAQPFTLTTRKSTSTAQSTSGSSTLHGTSGTLTLGGTATDSSSRLEQMTKRLAASNARLRSRDSTLRGTSGTLRLGTTSEDDDVADLDLSDTTKKLLGRLSEKDRAEVIANMRRTKLETSLNKLRFS